MRTTKIGPNNGMMKGLRALPSRAKRIVVPSATTPTTRVSISDMAADFKDIRKQMEEDEQLSVLMAGLRGQFLNDSAFAEEGVKMRLVEVSEDADDKLPLVYEPSQIAGYWSRRPVAVVTRIFQLLSIAGTFLGKVILDLLTGKSKENEVVRAIELRNIMTSLGPAYIKLGQALSIRPDLLSPSAMNELQKLCDKVPSFDNAIAMATIEQELGKPWQELYSELSPNPIAAASLGQVYKGKIKATGETVAVKVQRPYVLETVTVDLYIIRQIGLYLRRFPSIVARADIVSLLDEWAARFFEELDYVREGNNATLFAEQMKEDLPQVVVPKTYSLYTSRRVLTTGWLDGEKLSQSQANDVSSLVNVGVICYLKQLLETGFFHADPHPGNLIRTPDGRLAVLDFGLMTIVDDNIKYGMIEAIAHLIHRDYEAIVDDFVTLQFIPEGTDLKPILPVLARVFDQTVYTPSKALEGGGAKAINFQELAADLAQITFDYPFRIPPYFALIIRAIGVLEGIALVGNPNFAIVDEAYPFIAKMLLTDNSPRLRAALRYMIYGKEGIFDAERVIDILMAFETFSVNSRTAMGDTARQASGAAASSSGSTGRAQPLGLPFPSNSGSPFPFPFPFPVPAAGLFPFPPPLIPIPGFPLFPVPGMAAVNTMDTAAVFGDTAAALSSGDSTRVREALRFMFSEDGRFFREFLLDEVVKSIDAMSRDQARLVIDRLGLGNVLVPILVPGAKPLVPLAPSVTDEDRRLVDNVTKIVSFLVGGAGGDPKRIANIGDPRLAAELAPFLPAVATEVLPELVSRLVSRAAARGIREVFVY